MNGIYVTLSLRNLKDLRRTNRILQILVEIPIKLVLSQIKASRNFVVFDLRVPFEISKIHPRSLDYSRYVEVQTLGNKAKFDHSTVSSMRVHLTPLQSPVIENLPSVCKVLCHGVRNGSELTAWKSLVEESGRNVTVVGTDISPTANGVANAIQHDFHDSLPDHLGKFDLIFSNSLDQSNNPKKALETWINQLAHRGYLVLAWTESHGKRGYCELDPFSCEPELFPFQFLEWFGSQAYIEKLVPQDSVAPRRFFFVIRRIESI